MFNVSQSKVKTWRRCKYAYHLKYVENLRSKRKKRPLKFGSMVHEMIEAYANGDDPFAVLDEMAKKEGKLFRREIEEYGDIVADCRDIMTDYFNYWPEKSLTYVRFQKRAAEHEFALDMGDITFKGKIDAFVRTPSKLRFLAEHKTWGKAIPGETERWRNIQAPLYTRANDMLGWPAVDGVCWDYIRSKPPSKPQVLKNGKLGKKAIDTLPTRVRASLEELGVKPSEAKHLLASATKNQERYFQRIFTPTKKPVVDKVWSDFMETAVEMRDNHGKALAKNIDRHCDWCEFADICSAELRGADVDYIKETQYDVEAKDEHEIAAE